MTDMTSAQKSLEEYLAKREQEITQRRNMLLNRLQFVAEKLPEKYPSIRRILVIGSLAKPIFFLCAQMWILSSLDWKINIASRRIC